MSKQQQALKEKQIEREIEYYIFQDLENVLCLIGELEQTIHTLQDHKDKSYIPIATNKTILQANLSYGIHLDQYCSHNKTHGKFLEECNKKAKDIFEKVAEAKGINTTDPKINKICEFYLNKNLQATNSFHQLPLEPVSSEAQFNQNALEKVIWGTQTVSNQLNEVHKLQYKPPSVEQILEKINSRKKYCEEQLIKNFGIVKKVQLNETKDVKTVEIDQKEEENKTVNNQIMMQDQNNQVFEDQKQKNSDAMQIEDDSTEQLQTKDVSIKDNSDKSKENNDPNIDQQQNQSENNQDGIQIEGESTQNKEFLLGKNQSDQKKPDTIKRNQLISGLPQKVEGDADGEVDEGK